MPSKKKGGEESAGGLTKAARFGRVRNDLSMGFVGLPNVGKSTITNLLAGAMHAEAANYPFCTIDPNFVRCIVPDKKFDYLAELWKPPSIVPATMKVVDIAGLIKGASEGAGLGNAFLSHIAAVDGIFHLIRCFESEEVIHVDDSVDPIRDLETIQSELCLKDKSTMESLLSREKERVRKEKGMARSSDPPLSEAFQSAYEKVQTLLESKTPVHTGEFTMGEVEIIRDWQLITTKPQVYIVNMNQKSFIRKGNKWLPKIQKWVNDHGGGQIIPMSADFEQKCYDLREDSAVQKVLIRALRSRFAAIKNKWEEHDPIVVLAVTPCEILFSPHCAVPIIFYIYTPAFLDECTEEAKALGLTGAQFIAKSVVPRLIRAGRQALCLQSFYTAGPKEVRAWTIQLGTLAPQAAGVIHSDFERGFIKAEVANFDDFKELHAGQASMAKIKEAGKYRQEGKTYEMQDGDIVVFMHNVTASKKK